MIRAWILRICSMTVGIALGSSVLLAQVSPTDMKKVPVSVVMTSNFPYPGDIVILRRPDLVPSDLIVMRTETAQADLFSEAVRDLLDIRGIDGDIPVAKTLLRTRPSGSTTRRKLLPWSERVLNDLRGQPVQPFADFSSAQVIRIWLPRAKKAK